MNHKQVEQVMNDTFQELLKLRAAGQVEYCLDDNAFSNFIRVGAQLGVSKETALMIYAFKHFDGIAQHVKGRTSQRENVKGRINDLIVYMLLLKCMIIEDEDDSNVAIRNSMQAQMQGMNQDQMRGLAQNQQRGF